MKTTAAVNKTAELPQTGKTAPESYVLAAIVSASVPFFGLFHEWAALAVSSVVAVWLIVSAIRRGGTVVYRNLTTLAFFVLVTSYLVSTAYAIDRGAAFVGFLKFLPVLLFFIAAVNAPGFREAFLTVFPLFTAALTAVTALMMLIPPLHGAVTFEGRLHGFTQYPNTFAVILLAAEIMILGNKRIPVRIVGAAILAGGIFLTGSRAVIVLFAILNLFLLIRAFSKHKKAMLIAGAAAVVLVAGSFALGAAGVTPFDRLLRISFSESTFWCRIIYLLDALPFSLRHPFGVGYLGYSFAEASFQSAPYYVRFVHNDLMQMILDVGWIPAILFAVAAVRAVFSKKRPVLVRTAAAAVLLHCLFDFDLQFISVFFILAACMADSSGREIRIKNRALTAGVLGALAAVSVYFSAALSLSYFGKYEDSLRMYPFNTECRIKVMERTKEPDALERCADVVLRLNDGVADAYASKAAALYMKGEIGGFIENMREALDRAPFDYDMHESYCRLLMQGAEHYENAGDDASAAICRREIAETAARYKKTLDGITPLYKKTVISPVFEFPEDITSAIGGN